MRFLDGLRRTIDLSERKIIRTRSITGQDIARHDFANDTGQSVPGGHRQVKGQPQGREHRLPMATN
uniref:Transcriptional regulator n=1 Tax=Heterorhabditis bacteriophora TaxID=37862 RepID=A0A1I7XJ13_HETBA